MKMRKLYSKETTLKIIDSCKKKNKLINKTELTRYEELMKLLFDDHENKFSKYTRDLFEIVYKFVSPEKESLKLDRFEYEEMKSELREFIELAFDNVTGSKLYSGRRQDHIMTLINAFIDTIFRKTEGQEKVTIRYRKIFEFDSQEIQNKFEQDKILCRILLNEKKDKEEDEFPISFGGIM